MSAFAETDMKKIVADRARCIGSGNCVMLAPTLFTQREDDGLVEVIDSDVSLDGLPTVSLAVESCPGRALDIIEGGE